MILAVEKWRDVSAPAVTRPLTIGPYTSTTPVVLAPMAGITNPGFRRLCRRAQARVTLRFSAR